MRANLLQLITRNWPIKGAALFLALMLYVAVQLQQPVTTSFDVDLNVQLPPGRALVHKPPKVRVQISGKGSQILKLRSLAGDITRRVPDSPTAARLVVPLNSRAGTHTPPCGICPDLGVIVTSDTMRTSLRDTLSS